VVDTILRKARYPLSADWKQHKVYAGTGRAGRYVLSKDPQAMVAYDGLPLELRMRALGLHENAIVCNKSQQTL